MTNHESKTTGPEIYGETPEENLLRRTMFKSRTRKQDRPMVHVAALTANTCEVKIITESGETRLICSHDCIEVEAKGIHIWVKP